MTNAEGQCRCATQIEMWKPDKRGYWHLDSCPMYLNNRESSFAEGQGERWHSPDPDDWHPCQCTDGLHTVSELITASIANSLERQLREVTAERDHVFEENASFIRSALLQEQELASLRDEVERWRECRDDNEKWPIWIAELQQALREAKAALTQEGEDNDPV